jgi:predicted transporter
MSTNTPLWLGITIIAFITGLALGFGFGWGSMSRREEQLSKWIELT